MSSKSSSLTKTLSAAFVRVVIDMVILKTVHTAANKVAKYVKS